jgi:carboxylesterase type B
MGTQNETPLLEHPTIGRIRGINRIQDVTQFLGVQYATLRDRFSRGELIEQYNKSDAPLDATTHGPTAATLPKACDGEQGLIQHSLPHPEYEPSDTECLRLNIAIPAKVERQGLPVVVFFHGGGFFTGSSSWPQYDLATFVALSIKTGLPIVAVGVNYRVGAPGFLTSKAMREAGYKTNNGLDDQRLALRWVKRHIAGFAGDPEKVTWLGESAGAGMRPLPCALVNVLTNIDRL